MDFWNWIGVGAGLAIAFRELYPVWKNRWDRDAEWKRGLFWGCVALSGALAAAVSGKLSAAEVRELRGQVDTANTTAINADRRTAELEREAEREKRRTISTDQFDMLVKEFRKIKDGDKAPLYVIVAASRHPSDSFQVAGVLSDATLWGEVGGWHVEEITAEPTHDGFVLYVSEETNDTKGFVEAMASVHLGVNVAVGRVPDADLAKKVDEIRKQGAHLGAQVFVLHVGRLK